MTDMYMLDTCVWELTLQCCFSCRHCGSMAGAKRENELPLEEALKIARQLSASRCRRVILIGGEVFLYTGWEIIAGALTAQGIQVSIITNGFLLCPPIYKQMEYAGVTHVSVSIDGTQPIHDYHRQAGSFERAVDALKALSGLGFTVSVITTINKQNISELPELYKVLLDCGIHAWQLQACTPMGNAADMITLTPEDNARVVGFITSEAFRAPFIMGIADNIGYFSEAEDFIRGRKTGSAPFVGCRAGITSIGIDSLGNVRGCESLYDDKFIEGNLRQRSLEEIWHDPHAFKYNRSFDTRMLTGKCISCTYGARCGGGCRSMNYFVHGDMYGSRTCLMVQI